jgi:choline-sulfatase
MCNSRQGQGELYSYKEDPQEINNLYGERSIAETQAELHTKLLNHYVNTTGIAPKDKDSRDLPPFYSTRTGITPTEWQKKILDKS